MSHYVILNKAQHKEIRVITDRAAEYGDNLKYVMTFPFEFRDIQSYYPIFFCKDGSTGQFHPLALLGFEQQENLFLSEAGWDAAYVPMMIERHPFLIGFQAAPEQGEGAKKPVVSIDMDNPRVNRARGESLFVADGQPSDYLQTSIDRLEAIHRGHEHSQGFIAALLAYDLLEPFSLEITLDNGSNNQLLGFYTINEQRLAELDGDTFAELNKQGYLQAIYMAMASFSRLRIMIDKKNALLQ